MTDIIFDAKINFMIDGARVVKYNVRRFADQLGFTVTDKGTLATLSSLKHDDAEFPVEIVQGGTTRLATCKVKSSKLVPLGTGDETHIKLVIVREQPAVAEKKELNAVGKIALVTIQREMQQHMRERLSIDDVSRFDDLIMEASVCVLEIEQALAHSRANIVSALETLCRTQDSLERDFKAQYEKNPKGFENLWALLADTPELRRLKETLQKHVEKDQGVDRRAS